jgi:hypothetical protein
MLLKELEVRMEDMLGIWARCGVIGNIHAAVQNHSG